MFGHSALETRPRSQLTDDDHDRQLQAQHQPPWCTPNLAADEAFRSGRQIGPHCEGTANIDVLTHKFSNSHLRLDHCVPPSLARLDASACSSVTSFGQPPEPAPGMSSCCQTLSSEVPDRNASTLPTASTTEPSLTRQLHHPKHDIRRLRRKPSSRYLNEAQAKDAIQKRVEVMISSGDQCNVFTPSLVPVVPIEADDDEAISCEMGASVLEVDEGVSGDDESEVALIDRLLSLRRASGTLGIRKNGFPLYQSSTDTALRCQNLVRNKPRMRRRKAKQKPNPSTTHAAESLR